MLRRSCRVLIPISVAALFLLVPDPAFAQPVEIVHGFDSPPALTAAGLVEGPGGVLYGTSLAGGAFGLGTVYAITPAGDLTILHSFSGGSDGAAPQGGLVWVGGYLYGTTSTNPPAYNGTVFRIPTAGPLETLFTFSGSDGSRPYASLTLGSDGWLYGATIYGGTAGSNGTLFRIRPDGTGEEVLHHFSGTGDGRSPSAAVVEGEPGVFYGTTQSGGASSRGTIYKWSEAGGFATLLSFGPSNGSSPRCQLLKDANGTFWGTTAAGGTAGYGTVFQWPAASGPIVTVHSFGGAPGKYPASGLVLGPDGSLWGTTSGDYTSGATVYRIDPVSGAHSLVHAFPPGPVYAHGLLLAAGDGRIYGTNEGYSSQVDRGSVFSVDPRAGNTFATVRAFGLAEDGWEPQSLAAADDGTLYGTTHYGGGHGLGTAFQIGADGSFVTIHAFDDADLNGGIPSSTRVTVASDGVLYGTRSAGGGLGAGSVFAMTPAGSRTNLFDFSSTYGDQHGKVPSAALVEGTDGALYGTMVYGGGSGWGTVFRITKEGALTTLGTFSGVSTGSEPLGRLVEGSDGRLYGSAVLNGWNGYSAGWGTLFSTAMTAPAGILVVHQFANTVSGYSPEVGLIEAGPRRFFGGGRGGAFGNGVLFEKNLNSPSSYRVIHDFAGGPADGAGVSKELVRGTDGFLYGTTYAGGLSNQGTVFRIRPDATGYEVVHRFAGDDGSRGDGLTPGPDGNLYGITQMGGPQGGGVVFRVRLTPTVDAGGPYAFEEGGSVEVSATCNRGATFEWDLDENGSFETTGQTVTLASTGWDGPGTHTIRVRATDDGGLSATDTAAVSVANVAPTVQAGPDAALVAGGFLGQAGSFTDPGPDSWTATVDYGDGSGSHPLSLAGQAFKLSHAYPTAGTYNVLVSVSDDDGGVGTDTLVVRVSTVQDSIQGLIAAVQGLVGAGELNGGQGNSLISKLEAALNQLGRGNVTPARNALEAFVNEVSSYIQSGKLTSAEGQPLIDVANRVIAALS